jgi:hypothetical protein
VTDTAALPAPFASEARFMSANRDRIALEKLALQYDLLAEAEDDRERRLNRTRPIAKEAS